MANIAPIFVGSVGNAAVTIVNGDGTNLKTILTADSTNGSRVLAVSATSDDTALVNLDLWLTISSTDYKIGVRQVPIGAGYTTVAPINLLDPSVLPFLEDDGSLVLGPSVVFKASAQSAVTAAKTVTLVAHYGNY